MNEEMAIQYTKGYIDGFKEGKAIFEPKIGCKGCIYENAMIYQEKDRRITDQTLKDIDRAFKALEERDELLDKIRAEMENDWQLKKYPNSPFSCGLRRAIEIIDKYKSERSE